MRTHAGHNAMDITTTQLKENMYTRTLIYTQNESIHAHYRHLIGNSGKRRRSISEQKVKKKRKRGEKGERECCITSRRVRASEREREGEREIERERERERGREREREQERTASYRAFGEG